MNTIRLYFVTNSLEVSKRLPKRDSPEAALELLLGRVGLTRGRSGGGGGLLLVEGLTGVGGLSHETVRFLQCWGRRQATASTVPCETDRSTLTSCDATHNPSEMAG